MWRWNRGCYGITDGVPHLRIENRVLPSGPSVVDEVANAAFWLGLMRALGDRHPEVSRLLPFEQVRANFVAAARQGLAAKLTWLDGTELAADTLALDVLLPLAADGLAAAGVDSADRERYLGVVERRVRSGYTGSRWVLTSLNAMRNQGTAGQRLNSLTAAMVARQRAGTPVAEWAAANLDEGGQWRHNFVTIEQLMTTDLVTVAEDDPIELAANLMDWHRIRQVLVEDDGHRLIGLVSYRAMLRLLARGVDARTGGGGRRDEARPGVRRAGHGAAAGPAADAVVRHRRAAGRRRPASRRHRHRARLHERRRAAAARATRRRRAH